MQLNRYT